MMSNKNGSEWATVEAINDFEKTVTKIYVGNKLKPTTESERLAMYRAMNPDKEEFNEAEIFADLKDRLYDRAKNSIDLHINRGGDNGEWSYFTEDCISRLKLDAFSDEEIEHLRAYYSETLEKYTEKQKEKAKRLSDNRRILSELDPITIAVLIADTINHRGPHFTGNFKLESEDLGILNALAKARNAVDPRIEEVDLIPALMYELTGVEPTDEVNITEITAELKGIGYAYAKDTISRVTFSHRDSTEETFFAEERVESWKEHGFTEEDFENLREFYRKEKRKYDMILSRGKYEGLVMGGPLANYQDYL
jgi:hypothetical protein